MECSDEDQCYIESAPGLLYAGCHGDREQEVFEALCRNVEETIALYHQTGRELPQPTSNRDYVNKMQDVAWRSGADGNPRPRKQSFGFCSGYYVT